MISRRALIASTAAGVLALAGIAGMARADSVQPDGVYACGFNAGAFSCTPTVLPTVTETATVTATATATATTTVTATPSPTATTPSPSPSPTPTTAKLLTGTSSPGLGVFPDAKAVRYFWGGLPSSTLPAAPAGAITVVSFKTAPPAGTFGSELDAWAATGRQVYWTWHHEPDNGDMTGAAFVSGMNSLLSTASAHQHSNLHSSTILTANAVANGTADAYYVPGVEVIGFDCYQLVNEPKVLAYAAAKGKRVFFGEVGNVAGGSSPDTDALALAYAQKFWPALTSNVLAAMWWSGGVDTLTDKPMTTAYLRSVA